MSTQFTPHGHQQRAPAESSRLGLRALNGSGDRIGALVLPVAVVGVPLNLAFPDAFSVGGPPRWLQVVSVVLFAVGEFVWARSVVLILTKVHDGEFVTSEPYALVKHPLYTSVALLVLTWAGFLLDTWRVVVIGRPSTPGPGCSHRVRRPVWSIGSARSGRRAVRAKIQWL